MTGSGLLIVMSAPSGAGKQALLTRLRELEPGIVSTVSATTRAPRPGEVHGRDYSFLTRDEFDQRLAAGHFVEWAEVHGNRYGTLNEELDRCLETGDDVLLELDVQGMRHLRALRPDVATVFLLPPSFEELERRLRKRNANAEDDMALRLRNAREEIACKDEFDYQIVNDDLDRAVAEMAELLRRERQRRGRASTC
jgi:guanylate kinase